MKNKKTVRFTYVKHGNGFLVYQRGAHLGNVFQKYGWWQNNHSPNLHQTRHAAAKKLLE